MKCDLCTNGKKDETTGYVFCLLSHLGKTKVKYSEKDKEFICSEDTTRG